MNLRQWALAQGIHPQTAYRWYRESKLPVPPRKTGRLILVGDLETPITKERGRTVVYAHVTSASKPEQLNEQVTQVLTWAVEHDHSVDQMVTEIGLARQTRAKLLALLRDPSISMIIVDHEDRLGACGAECVEAALAAQGRRVLVATSPASRKYP